MTSHYFVKCGKLSIRAMTNIILFIIR